MAEVFKVHDQEVEALIQSIAAGDKEALGALYESTHTAVYGFALSICKNIQDAEDVLHDVYVQIWNASQSYKTEGKPMAWVFTMTRNFALMCIRKNSRMVDVESEEWKHKIHEYAKMNLTVTDEDMVILDTLLEKLSHDERQVIALHALWGFKHREISKLLNSPLSTVLSRYHRAIKKLGKEVE